jgi:hypothetical protein
MENQSMVYSQSWYYYCFKSKESSMHSLSWKKGLKCNVLSPVKDITSPKCTFPPGGFM